MCGLLLLKKKMLTECVDKHLKPKEHDTMAEKEYQLPLTRLKRMQQPTEKDIPKLRSPYNIETDLTGQDVVDV
jgi:hypothetical protein